MKTSNVYLLASLLLMGLLMISCSTIEKTTIACPEFKAQKQHLSFEFKFNKQYSPTKRSFDRTPHVYSVYRQKMDDEVQHIPVKNIGLENDPLLYNLKTEFVNFVKQNQLPSTNTKESTGSDRKIENKNSFRIQNKYVPDSCDLIVLLNGREIRVKHLEIGTDSIKYQLCESLDGPIFGVSKSVIFKIKLANGNEVNMNGNLNLIQSNQKKAFGNPGIIGLLISTIGLILLIISTISLSAGYLRLLSFLILLIGLGFGVKGLLNRVKNKPKDDTDIGKKEIYIIMAILIGSIPIFLILLLVIGVISLMIGF